MNMLKKKPLYLDNSGPEGDIVDLISSKGYLPGDSDLPKTTYVKKIDNDVTFLLSKLSDAELIKLLGEQPNKDVFDMNDVIKITLDSNTRDVDQLNLKTNLKTTVDIEEEKNKEKYATDSVVNQGPIYRLEHKQVDPYKTKTGSDLNYVALQKINNMLYGRPAEHFTGENNDNDENKQLLFDSLVAQLKTLCCKNTKKENFPKNQPDLNRILYPNLKSVATVTPDTTEHLFLIINDEIRSNGNEDLISVDPDSLQSNSSVLLLGPITSPLNDNQLKLVMNKISQELLKSEYLPLLQQMSEGTLNDSNVRLMKSVITGPDTRRYIKPHRCNYQSQITKVYYGPRWIICTGYLNLNRPSPYD